MQASIALMFMSLCWGPVVASQPARADDESAWFRQGGDGRFSLQCDPSGREFVVGGSSFSRLDDATRTDDDHEDAVFARGRRITFQDKLGHRLSVSRHTTLPFTLIQGTFRNAGSAPLLVNGIDVALLPLDLGVPVSELRILGTGGLSDAATAPGSYMWIAVVDPKTRGGVVAGWLTSSRGSGVVIPKVVDGRLTISARLEYGRLRIHPTNAEELETFVVGWFADARLGLEAYADAVAKVHQVRLPAQPSGYCTWYHAGSSSAKRIAKLAEFAASNLKPFGFSVIQIDDGWQAGRSKNGPKKNFTTHWLNGPFPDGMKPTAARIAGLSLTPGLWFMPFAGTWDDPFFGEHQAWFAKREDGTPFDTNWGGTCLDLTRPEVLAYLRENVERITRQWGYRYLKMDGLWTGSATEIQYVNDSYKDDHLGNAVLSNPDKTNIEALRDGLKLIRETAGADVFLLGCCAPQNMRSYGGAFGLLDAMRIGPDNGATVDGLRVGPRYGSRNYFLNGRVWWNDPDPVYVRKSLSLAQAELSCTWAAIAGQMTIASDELERLPADRLDILKRIIPSHAQPARPVDIFDRDLPSVWVVPATDRLPGHTVVGLFNWEQDRMVVDEPMERLGLDPRMEYAAFEFWSGRLLPAVRGRLRMKLEPLDSKEAVAEEKAGGPVRHCCAALAIRPLSNHPQLLSTARHVTQGLVDVEHEEWDEETRRLTAVSRVVGGDPYVLRILTRSAPFGWKLTDLSLSPEDVAVGATIADLGEEQGLIRATIHSPVSRQVKWTAQFVPLEQ